MKKLLLPILLCISTLTFAQSEKSGFFKHIYTKLSPTLFIPVDGNLTPAVFGTIGVKYDKYVALGISGGYFKYNQEAKAVMPLGVELTVTNFKAQKIAPIFTAQIFKPANYEKNERDSWTKLYPSGSYVIYEDHLTTYQKKGKSLFSVAAGATIPLGNNRLAFTAGYSQLAFKTLVGNSVHVYRSIHSSYRTYSNIRMVNISLSFIF
jgi:hypothetical protein